MLNIDTLDELEKKYRNISIITTGVITVLVILMLLLFNLKLPDKPKTAEEMGGGVAVSFGDPNMGGQNEVPIDATYVPPSAPAFDPEEMTEQTLDEEAVAVPKSPDKPNANKKKINNQTTPTTTPTKSKEQLEEEAMQRKMEELLKNRKANGGNGNTPGTGGERDGVPGGNANGRGSGTDGRGNGSGSGNGDDGYGPGTKGTPGVKHTFGNRSLRGFTTASSDDCNAQGRVTVDVRVAPNGKITVLGINPSSKSNNACLNNLAKQIAANSKFAASENNISIEGTITYDFQF